MRAFSIIELLISVTLIVSVISGAILIAVSIPNSLLHSARHSEAIANARATISGIFARKSYAFSTEHLPELQPYLTASIGFEELYPSGIKLTSTKSFWRTANDETREVSLGALVADYSNAASYRCSPLISNVGDRTRLVPRTTLPNISSLSGNYSVLLATTPITTPNTPSVFLYSHGDTEILLTGTHTRSASTTTGYIASALNTTHAFLLSADTCPTKTSCASLDVFALQEGGIFHVSSQNIPSPRSIFLSGNYLYVGLRNQPQDSELLVFDISEPDNPQLIGDAEIGSSAHSIAADKKYLYVATADNSTAGDKSLMVFDTSNVHPAMRPISHTTQPGAGMSQKIYLLGSTLVLGRTALHNSKELYFFDSSDLRKPLASNDTATNVVDLLMRGPTALVLTKTNLQQWIQHTPTNPHERSASIELPPQTEGVALACAGRHVFVAGNSPNSGTIFSLP